MPTTMSDNQVREWLKSVYGDTDLEQLPKLISEMKTKFRSRTNALVDGDIRIKNVNLGYVKRKTTDYVDVTLVLPTRDGKVELKDFGCRREIAESLGVVEKDLPVAIVTYQKEGTGYSTKLVPWDTRAFKEYTPLIKDFKL